MTSTTKLGVNHSKNKQSYDVSSNTIKDIKDAIKNIQKKEIDSINIKYVPIKRKPKADKVQTILKN